MSLLKLSLVDTTILATYFIAILAIGSRQKRKRAVTTKDYLIAGRKITLPAFIASLVSTWYGGILGVGEFTYSYGISNWLVFGVPYYLFAIIFALFLAARARETEVVTIPDQMEKHYGRKAGLVSSVFVFLLTLPAPYLLMLGVLITLFVPIPLWVAVSLGALFSFAYLFRNGFLAVVRTDLIQFGLMFGGFIVLLVALATQYGGWSFLAENLPESHLTWHGGNSFQYILVWYVIAASTLVDPNFYQRCFAAKSVKVARTGILVSVLFWIVFDFLTTTTGLYARVLLPGLANPVETFPRIAELVLPPIAKGVFFTSLFATVMSTLDSFAFVSAVSIGRDFLWKILRKGKELIPRYTKYGLVISLVASIALALFSKSVVDLWYQLGSVVTPALAIPLMTSFSARWRMAPWSAVFCMVSAGGVSLAWLIFNIKTGQNLLGLEPIYAGLAVSVVVYVGQRIFPKTPHRTPSAGSPQGL